MSRWLFGFVVVGGTTTFAVMTMAQIFVAVTGLVGYWQLSKQQGTDGVLLFLQIFFGFLFVGELGDLFFVRTKNMFRSVVPNLFAVFLRACWMLFASLIFYGALIGRLALGGNSLILFAIGATLFIYNAFLLAIHISLCIPKVRGNLLRREAELGHSSQ